MKSVTLPLSLEYIGERSFSNCFSLEKVVIYSQSLQFSYGCFWKCYELKTVEYYGTKEPEFGSLVFAGCETLKTIYVPTNYEGSLTRFCGRSLTISNTLQT